MDEINSYSENMFIKTGISFQELQEGIRFIAIKREILNIIL